MSRRALVAAAVAAALVGSVLLGRSCLRRGGDMKGAAGPARSAAPARSARPVGAAARAAAPRASGGAADGGGAAGPAFAVSAGWGGRLGQLGRDRPMEGNPEAPMSFAVDGKGRMLVLDQVNSRVVRYGADGKPEAEFGADLRTAQDVAVGDDGTVAVMDRFTEKAVTLYDASGEAVGKLPLVGEGVDEPGNVTGVFVDDGGVYVERQHGPLVKIGDASGNPAEPRTEIPGRPSRDGLSYVTAGIIDAAAGRAYVSSTEKATMAHRFTRELRLEARVLAIVLLDTDRSGVIYFGTLLGEGPDDELIQVTCLEPVRGQPIGVAVMPANTMPEETFRDLAVLDDGGILYALRTEQGITYERYDCK